MAETKNGGATVNGANIDWEARHARMRELAGLKPKAPADDVQKEIAGVVDDIIKTQAREQDETSPAEKAPAGDKPGTTAKKPAANKNGGKKPDGKKEEGDNTSTTCKKPDGKKEEGDNTSTTCKKPDGSSAANDTTKPKATDTKAPKKPACAGKTEPKEPDADKTIKEGK